MKRLAAIALLTIAVFAAVLLGIAWRLTSMPGEARPSVTVAPYSESAGEPSEGDATLHRSERLRVAVFHLAETIGERSLFVPDSLDRTATWIASELAHDALTVQSIEFPVRRTTVRCIEATLPGTNPTAAGVVVGAHYDSFLRTPGANDNASGTAALLELARTFADRGAQRRTIRFVAFPNEEPPYFQTAEMGSLQYAESLRTHGVTIEAMISLESLGYFDDEEGSQGYPQGLALLYPSAGDFVGFVTNVEHGDLVRRAIEVFRRSATIPSEGASFPGSFPGIGWSDHWSFWQIGVPAFMVTDTAIFRDPEYHQGNDTPERLDYVRMAAVVDGLVPVIAELAND